MPIEEFQFKQTNLAEAGCFEKRCRNLFNGTHWRIEGSNVVRVGLVYPRPVRLDKARRLVEEHLVEVHKDNPSARVGIFRGF